MTEPADPVGTIFDRVGEAAICGLVGRFYARVRNDDLIGPMYPPGDWENAERRLRLFLIQRFGGPPTYSEQRGHPRLRMRHAPFAITEAAAVRWLELMRDSLAAADDIPADVSKAMWPYFVSTANFMVNALSPAPDAGS